MQLRTIFIFLAGYLGAALAQEKPCVLLAVSGEVQVRGANELDWRRAEAGRILQDRETLRSGFTSSARLRAFDGKIFVLPEHAQIEIRELQSLSRDEVVLELTALEMQKLPAKKDSTTTQPNAFVLHGALPDSLAKKAEISSFDYLRREERGALALFEQGFFAGFILKWNRLVNAVPDFASEPVEVALIKAYEAMNMPFRMQQARERFQQRWPKQP